MGVAKFLELAVVLPTVPLDYIGGVFQYVQFDLNIQ